MATKGGRTSGIASTRRRWYETMPSTVRANITMVANTGWLIETRVIHIGLTPGFFRLRLAVGLAAELLAQHLGGAAMLELVELGGEHHLGGLHAGQDLDHRAARIAHAGAHRPALEAPAGDDPHIGVGAVASHRADRQGRHLAVGVQRE